MTVRNFTVSTEPGVQAGLSDFFHVQRAIVFVALLVSCASPPPVPSPNAPVPAPPPPATVAAPAPTRWQIVTATSAANFLIETRATFNARADSLARSDTSVSRTVLRVVPRGAAVDVTINAYSINSSYSQPLALTSVSRAVGRFDGHGGIAFEGPGQGSCTALSSAAFESTRDLWVRWPADVVVGTRWRDSTVASACRDGVPLRVTIVRNYRVTAASTDTLTRLIDVERTSTVSVTGRGLLRGDSITVSGEGSGSARLRVAAATGWLFDGNGSSALQLRAVSKARTQVVDQQVEFTLRQTETPR
jgi:hypothetical protein